MIEKPQKDKMVRSPKKALEEGASTPVEIKEQDYFFPNHSITIKAVSLAEAEKRLLEIISKKAHE